MSQQTISVEFDKEKMQEVRNMFAGTTVLPNKVMSMALNKAMTGIKSDMTKAVGAVLNTAQKNFNSNITIHKAGVDDPSGSIIITGKIIAMGYFNPKQTATGVSVKVYKNEAAKIYPRTFVASVKAGKSAFSTGHTGIFKREYARKNISSAQPGSKKRAWARMAAKYRLPLYEYFGPRLTTVFLNKDVYDIAMRNSVTRQVNELNVAINYQMKKLQDAK